MDYLRMKYDGYERVATSNLQIELLLGAGEFMLLKKEVREALGVQKCPNEIGFDLFESLVELHL